MLSNNQSSALLNVPTMVVAVQPGLKGSLTAHKNL